MQSLNFQSKNPSILNIVTEMGDPSAEKLTLKSA